MVQQYCQVSVLVHTEFNNRNKNLLITNSCAYFYRWWPEIPIVLAIFYTNVIMGGVLYHVYKQEKSSSRYTGGSNKLFKQVFKQACLFVGAFYITWMPYLVLQVSFG